VTKLEVANCDLQRQNIWGCGFKVAKCDLRNWRRPRWSQIATTSCASSSVQRSVHDCLGDLGHEVVVECVWRVAGAVIVRVAKFGRVGEHGCGNATLPERRVIAAQ